VSMPCTEEQYNRDLKEGLEKLGYEKMEALSGTPKQIICTQYSEANNHVAITTINNRHNKNRHFIPEYNPELFLAIAGMREGYADCAEGEYLYFVKGNSR